MRAWAFVHVACAALASGCVAVPFASPPVQMAVGGGVLSHHRDTTGPTPAVSTGGAFQFRAGVYPLALFPDRIGRVVDFGIGYGVEAGPSLLHGPHVDIGAAVVRHPLPNGSLVRLLVRGQWRLLVDGAQRVGGGGALQLAFELASFANAPFTSSSRDAVLIGHHYGESAIGLYLEGAAGTFGAGDILWNVTGGLLIRLPASAGVALVWITALLRK